MKKLLLLSLICICLSSCNWASIQPRPKEQTVTIYGLVQDMFSSDMLADVVISSDSIQIGNIVTGSDGNFQFTITYSTQNIINLTASKRNYAPETQFLNLESLNRNKKSIDFQLRRLSIIYTGIITDAQTGMALSDVKIHAKIQNGTYIGAVGTVFSDINGKYVLEINKPTYESWKYYVTANKDGYKVETYTFSHTQADVGETVLLNFQLENE